MSGGEGVKDWVVASSLVLVGAVAAGVRYNDQLVGLTGDNATYILLARDLLSGSPYSNAGYPWGYPALLAPILAATGSDNMQAAIPWMKLLTLLLFLASLPLVYTLFRMRHGVGAAFVAALLFAVNNTALFHANDVMSEIPYTCVGFLALLYWQKVIAPWACDKSLAQIPWRRLLLAGLLLAAPYYVRTVGAALLAASVLLLLFYRKARAALALGLLLAVLALPWALSAGNSNLNSYSNQFLLHDPYNPALGKISSAGEFLGRLVEAANIYLNKVFPSMVLPAPTPDGLVGLIAPLLTVLMLGGLCLQLLRRVELPEIYTLLFLVALFAWPWKGDRFLLPIYPLLLHYLVEGATRLWGQFVKLRPPRRATRANALLHRLTVGAAVLLLALPNLWLAGGAGAENLRYLKGEAPAGGHTPDWQSYFAACRWLRDNAPSGSLAMSRKSTLTTVYSDLPSIQIPLVPPDQYPDFIRENKVDYVLEDAFTWSTHTNDYLRPALEVYPDMFVLVEQTLPPVVRVWKVLK